MQKEQDEQNKCQEREEQRQGTEAETAQAALLHAHTLAERVAAYRGALHNDPRIARLHILEMPRPLEVMDSYVPLRLHQDPRPGYELEWVVQSNDPHALMRAHRWSVERRVKTTFLEHLPEQELPVALAHLLKITAKRLLIAVPYEEKIQSLYRHHQAFTSEKLHTWGKWCVERLGENSRYWCEDLMGGLLVVEWPLEEQ